jgi:hypothetical protein
MEGVGRQNWARGRIPIFRKIHLYGKSAKSTHGHTKKKPTQPFFSDLAVFRLPRLPYTRGPTLEPPTLRRGTYPAGQVHIHIYPYREGGRERAYPAGWVYKAYPAAAYPMLKGLP